MRTWHYTIEVRVRSIKKDLHLKPAYQGIPEREIPVLWFSRNPRWEPTASKIAIHRSGQVRLLTTKEMFSELGDQLYRFSYPVDHLMPWHILKRKARISTKEQRRLIKKAKEQGSNYLDWYGTTEPIWVDDADLKAEKWNPIRKIWEPVALFDSEEIF